MRLSTSAQFIANQANAQHSTGPKTPEGKAIVAQNNFQHGLSGAFRVLDWESQEEYRALHLALEKEHQPATPTEEMLVETMAHSYWLRQARSHPAKHLLPQRIARLQRRKTSRSLHPLPGQYDRAFHRALNDLLKLRAEKRKQEIGFESPKHK